MRTDVVRLYKTVHTWTGLVTGLFLFIAFYAGALTMFKQPLTRWAAPPAQALTPAAQWPELVAQVALARHGAPFTLHLQDGEEVPARVTWEKNGASWGADLDAGGRYSERPLQQQGPAQWIDTLHRTAGLPGSEDFGAMVMGLVSAVYAVALISGVIVLLPTLVKDFMALRIGHNRKRLWLDAHNVVGLGSLPFHLVMACSAVVFGLHDEIYEAQGRWVYAGEVRIPTHAPPAPAAPVIPDASSWLPPAPLLQPLRESAPDFEPVWITYRSNGRGEPIARVAGYDPTHFLRSAHLGYAILDPHTGAVTDSTYLPGHQQGWAAPVTAFFALHFGSYGGSPVRWTYFLLGLAGSFLFYSGNLLWIESRRKKLRRGGTGDAPAQNRGARFMAALSVGVSLGCICGISLTIAAARWLHGNVESLASWHQAVYYAVFLGCIGWAFRRGAARAAPDLLWAASAATAAITLSSLLAWLLPGAGGWTSGSIDALTVDLVALAGAVVFAQLARLTRRRTRAMAADSVWCAASDSPHPAHSVKSESTNAT